LFNTKKLNYIHKLKIQFIILKNLILIIGNIISVLIMYKYVLIHQPNLVSLYALGRWQNLINNNRKKNNKKSKTTRYFTERGREREREGERDRERYRDTERGDR
jgi:hypothetical protein